MKEDIEEWRPIRDFEAYYAVSNQGQIRRIAPGEGRGRGVKVGRNLKGSMNRCGYLHVKLRGGGKRADRTFHSVVTDSFLGPRPLGLEVNHRDGVKTNNRVENLEYVTRGENLLHAYRVLGHMVGSKHPHAKLTEAQVLQIRSEYEPWITSAYTLAKKYGVSSTTIGSIVTRKSWNHV